MRRVVGIGETVFDIIFKNNQPTKAMPGGTVFNTMISLGRLGMKPMFISEIGRDKVGESILEFMSDNNVSTEHMYRFYDNNSPVSLAFLNDSNQAEYVDYINYPEQRLDIVWPRLDKDDVIIFGSFYSLNISIRPTLTDLLNYAVDRKAIIIYDPDFRPCHKGEAVWVMPSIIENFEYANIVRGSLDDFRNIYKETEVAKIFRNHIKFYCQNFICTDGANGIYLLTTTINKHYRVPPLEVLSKVGAGDSFNSGLIYALDRLGVEREMIDSLDEAAWDEIIRISIDFATNVCLSFENYISRDLAESYSVNEFNKM